ncbi:protein-trafficking protein SEC22-like [Vairimorpha necatrix]|uniref:Protein-trafficking protein SEC22-like n=1 Tax=Vairimorpha necatrix TaxID=6039 RepID=A0AAX4J8C6_9MICR
MTIFYTLVRDGKSKKIISGEFSPQSQNIKISKDILKELRDADSHKILKMESSRDPKFLFLIYPLSPNIFSVIVDQYETDQNIINYIEELNRLLKEKEYKQYEFDNVIKDKSNEFNKDKTLQEIDETKNVLADSLNLIIQRRENIDNISKLADKLTYETREMHTNIKKMKFDNLARAYGIYGIVIFIIILILYYICH